MSTLISFKKCKSLEIKSLLTSLLRQGDTMEIVLNEILPQWFPQTQLQPVRLRAKISYRRGRKKASLCFLLS